MVVISEWIQVVKKNYFPILSFFREMLVYDSTLTLMGKHNYLTKMNLWGICAFCKIICLGITLNYFQKLTKTSSQRKHYL